MHKKSAYGCILAAAILGGILIRYSEEDNHLTQARAAQMMEQDDTLVVLDVRSEEEYAAGHIPKARLLPVEDIRKGMVGPLPEDKNRTILVYCWTGRRSEDAIALLKKKGYKHVYNLGGIVDWDGPLTERDEAPPG